MRRLTSYEEGCSGWMGGWAPDISIGSVWAIPAPRLDPWPWPGLPGPGGQGQVARVARARWPGPGGQGRWPGPGGQGPVAKAARARWPGPPGPGGQGPVARAGGQGQGPGLPSGVVM